MKQNNCPGCLQKDNHKPRGFMLLAGFGFWNLVVFSYHPGEFSAPDVPHGVIKPTLNIFTKAIHWNDVWMFKGTGNFSLQME